MPWTTWNFKCFICYNKLKRCFKIKLLYHKQKLTVYCVMIQTFIDFLLKIYCWQLRVVGQGWEIWNQFAVDIIENMIFFFLQFLAIFSTKPVASCKCGLPASFDIILDGKPCEEFPTESPSAWCKNCTYQLCPGVPQSENCIKPEWKEGCQLILDATTNETMFSGLPEVNGVNVGTATAKILVEDCCNTIK